MALDPPPLPNPPNRTGPYSEELRLRWGNQTTYLTPLKTTYKIFLFHSMNCNREGI